MGSAAVACVVRHLALLHVPGSSALPSVGACQLSGRLLLGNDVGRVLVHIELHDANIDERLHGHLLLQ
eukprot:1388530-Amphidinium_carterae.3